MNGKGKVTFSSGMVYEGDFKDCKFHGKGRTNFTNGCYYEGDYFQGKVDPLSCVTNYYY